MIVKFIKNNNCRDNGEFIERKREPFCKLIWALTVLINYMDFGKKEFHYQYHFTFKYLW